MKVTELPLDQIKEAPWNANQMDQAMRTRLRHSIERFQLVVPLVVRPIGDLYETIGGAQRLTVLQELGISSIPCVIVEIDDPESRLLSQALNRIQGEDDLGLRAELLREVFEKLPQEGVLTLLPETAQSLQALASLGQEDVAGYLRSYQQAQGARLRHMTFQFTSKQLAMVEAALAQALAQVKEKDAANPNVRGNALVLICESYMELIRRNS